MNDIELNDRFRNDLESPVVPKKSIQFVARVTMLLVCIIFVFQIVWAVIAMKIYSSGLVEEIALTIKEVRELIMEVKHVIDPFGRSVSDARVSGGA